MYALIARAVALVLVGLVVVAAGVAGLRGGPEPEPVRSYRPATEQERQDQDRRLLEGELDRLWEQRQQPDHRRQELP